MGSVSTYNSTGSLLVAALSGHLESNIVGSVALDFNGTGGDVVEVLVQQLYGKQKDQRLLYTDSEQV
jgi:hypothetical protein